jgi:hypothetical protein
MCEAMDKDALVEALGIVRAAYDTRLRREMEKWHANQEVLVKIDETYVRGKIRSVNKNTVTVDLGRKTIRVAPSALRPTKDAAL